MADDKDKRLPSSTYKAEYPWCATHISRSGHEFHVDDTPGQERLRQAHKVGSYWEISPDGRKVTLTVSDEYQYVKGGLTLTVDNNWDVLIGGNMRLVIDGDCYAQIKGDLTSVVGGNASTAVMGNAVSMVKGDSFSKVKGSASMQIDGNLNADVKKDAEISVKGNVAMVSQGTIEMEGKRVRITATAGPCVIKGLPVKIVQG